MGGAQIKSGARDRGVVISRQGLWPQTRGVGGFSLAGGWLLLLLGIEDDRDEGLQTSMASWMIFSRVCRARFLTGVSGRQEAAEASTVLAEGQSAWIVGACRLWRRGRLRR